MPDFPKEPDRGSHTVPLRSLLYIECSDFMEEGGGKGFRRLTATQPVGLKYTSSTISVQQVVRVSVCVCASASVFVLCVLLYC